MLSERFHMFHSSKGKFLKNWYLPKKYFWNVHVGTWAVAGGCWRVSGPLCHQFPSTDTSVSVFLANLPPWSLPDKSQHLWSGNLFINPKRFFFAEHFWALADYYFNFFPQIFSPYLGKARDQGLLHCLFQKKLQCLRERSGFPGLLSFSRGFLGRAFNFHSAGLWQTPVHTPVVVGREMSVHKNSWRNTPPFAQEFFISGISCSLEIRICSSTSWQVRAKRPSSPSPVLQWRNWHQERDDALRRESFSPNVFTLKNFKSIESISRRVQWISASTSCWLYTTFALSLPSSFSP